MNDETGQFLINTLALVIATFAAIHHFGWIDGLGIGAALYTLLPYHPRA